MGIIIILSSVRANFDLLGENIETGRRFSVTQDAGDQVQPGISGKTAVWLSKPRNESSDGRVYGEILP
ncbi:MAG: hypothetical protein DLM70_02725 [Chloroflexi bacterium]|nr:MAG: hypothetical protein DLM70_02725 [Chloroflexota bacterium]